MPSSRKSSRTITTLALCAILLPGCSNGNDDGLFSMQSAQDLAQRFHEALAKGDVATAVGLARVPFRYKDPKRVWPDAASLQANLAKEIPRIQHLLAGLDRVEAFSRRDLQAGKWPRG